MTKKELEKKVVEYKEFKAMLKEAQAEVDRLEEELKKELAKKKVSELSVGDSVVRYTPYVQKRFDSKGFKAENPAVYEQYVREVEGHRFSVA